MAEIDNSLGQGGSGGGIWGTIIGNVIDQTDLINYLDLNFYPLLTNPLGYLTSFTEEDPIFTSWLATNPLNGFITQTTADGLYYPLLSNPSNYLTQQQVIEREDYATILADFPIGASDTIYIANNNSTTGIPVYYTWNGVTYVTTIAPITGVTGSGTANRITKWLTPTTIGNSIMYENGTRIGIGTQNPVSILSLTDTNNLAYRGITLTQIGNNKSGSLFNFRKSKGTEAVPLPVQATDYTGLFFAYNHDGSQFIANGSFGYYVNGAVSANNVSGEWFWAATNAHDVDPYTSGSVRMVLNSVGNLGLNTLIPTERFHMTGNIRVTGAYLDSTNSPGTSGQVLSSTVTGTAWTTVSAGVTSVTASAPLASSGGATPNITITQATTSTNGYLSSTDWNTFNGKFTLPALTNGSVIFSDGTTLSQDNANFFWDNTNKRLNLGAVVSPIAKLNILDDSLLGMYIKSASTSASIIPAVRFENLSNRYGSFSITPNNLVQINNQFKNQVQIGNDNGPGGLILYSASGPLYLKAGAAPAASTNATTPIVVSILNNFLIGTNTDNAIDKLQVAGSALISTKLGIGVTPAARVHISAGSAAAASAPIKLTSGPVMTTPETGSIEYNGANLFFTRTGTIREGILTQSAITTEVVVSDTTVTVNIGGVTYKLLAKA